MSKKLVSQANLLVFGVLVAFLVVIGFTTWDRMTAARLAREWTEHTYSVLGAIQEFQIADRGAESDDRGYLLTGNPDYLGPYDAALSRGSVLLGDLKRLTADNPAQQARLQTLAPSLAAAIPTPRPVDPNSAGLQGCRRQSMRSRRMPAGRP